MLGSCLARYTQRKLLSKGSAVQRGDGELNSRFVDNGVISWRGQVGRGLGRGSAADGFADLFFFVNHCDPGYSFARRPLCLFFKANDRGEKCFLFLSRYFLGIIRTKVWVWWSSKFDSWIEKDFTFCIYIWKLLIITFPKFLLLLYLLI